MVGLFQSSPLWRNADFSLQKGVLGAEATVAGSDLGYGMIYYPGSQQVKHRIIGVGDAEQIILDRHHNSMRVWSPGPSSEIVNESGKPANLFRVTMAYDPGLVAESEDLVQSATGYLLRSEWPEAFKSSVRTDLQAIGSLAKPFASYLLPTLLPARLILPRNNILRAKRAKEDLEFKLAWLNAATRELKFSYNFLLSRSWIGLGSEISPRFDGTITVNVHTKSTDGRAVSGYEVWANAYINEDDKREAEPFSQLSTPTEKRLAVGRYSMWAQRGNTTTASRIVTIGSLDTPLVSAQVVDLPV